MPDKENIPANPQAQPTETVEALEADATGTADEEQGVPAEDVTENPDTDELEELPGPSENEANESAG